MRALPFLMTGVRFQLHITALQRSHPTFASWLTFRNLCSSLKGTSSFFSCAQIKLRSSCMFVADTCRDPARSAAIASFFTRNIGWVTPKIGYFYYVKNVFTGSKYPQNILFYFENSITDSTVRRVAFTVNTFRIRIILTIIIVLVFTSLHNAHLRLCRFVFSMSFSNQSI